MGEGVHTRVRNAQEESQPRSEHFPGPLRRTNPAEFFAVATEYFFDRPVRMQKRRRELYDILSGFYNQDPAARVRRRRKSR